MSSEKNIDWLAKTNNDEPSIELNNDSHMIQTAIEDDVGILKYILCIMFPLATRSQLNAMIEICMKNAVEHEVEE